MSSTWYCPSCGYVGQQQRITKGSFGMELLLWLCLIAPGVLYSLWRLTTRYKGCPMCKAAGMIPADSPKAKTALAS